MTDRLPRPYWRLWWASGIDSIGDGVYTTAVPLVAAGLTDDPRLVALVSAATYLPWLLLSLPAGALADRHDRIALMWRAQVLQGTAVAVVAVLLSCHLLGLAGLATGVFVMGVGEVVFGNAAQAVLPEIVAKPLLHRANGAQQTVSTIGQLFLGPPLGSLLLALAVGLPFGVDAASFALSAALVATLPRRPRTTVTHPPMRTAVAEGMRWLAAHRLLRTLALLLGANTFCSQLANATLVLLATRTLHVSERGFGLLLVGIAAGSVLGGLVNARVVAAIGELPALLTALLTNVVVFVAVGFSPDAVVLGALLSLNGFATTLWNIVTVSLRQQVVPSELLGRVNSVYRMLGWGLMPLGAVAGGFVAHTVGLRAPFPVAGGLRLLALLAAAPVLVRAMRSPSGAPAAHRPSVAATPPARPGRSSARTPRGTR